LNKVDQITIEYSNFETPPLLSIMLHHKMQTHYRNSSKSTT